MSTCRICGETMAPGTRTCSQCGSSLPDVVPTAGVDASPTHQGSPAVIIPQSLPPSGRFCPVCGTIYSAEFIDSFCRCGIELSRELTATPPSDAPGMDNPAVDRPPAGTCCLVLYGPQRQPLLYFPLTKDVTAIGRLDATGGNFPDIDLDEWLDPPNRRRLSRQHALVLRSRATGVVLLRPLPGNTGTQVESEMVLANQDYPLSVGQRFVLGGVARFKLEIS